MIPVWKQVDQKSFEIDWLVLKMEKKRIQS